MISKKFHGLLATLGFVLLVGNLAHAQQPDIFKPYELDDNTLMLLHFDGDLKNASPQSQDAYAGKYSTTKIQFVGSVNNDLGQALWIINDTVTDSSEISVPHEDVLNLTGDFTVEGWLFVVTLPPVVSQNWNVLYPIVIGKMPPRPGAAWYWQDLPWMIKLDNWNSTLHAQTHVYVPGAYPGSAWQNLQLETNAVQLGEWYHFVMVADSANKSQGLMLQDANGQVVSVATGLHQKPLTESIGPVQFGVQGWIQNNRCGRLNAIYDEVRISDVVRDYAFPPVVGDLKTVFADRVGGNAFANETVQISADVRTIGNSTLSGAPTLYYRPVGSTASFTEIAMMPGDSTVVADIPAQPVGTQMEYYIAAETVQGLRVTLPSEAEKATDPTYSGVGWIDPEALVLDIDFDNQVTVDSSSYQHEVVMGGENLIFSTDVAPAAGGTHSMSINEATGLPDTCYVAVPRPTPFINATLEGYTVDFWFKISSFDQAVRHYIFNKEGFASVESFSPSSTWSYGYRANLGGSVRPWPFDLPLNRWLHIRMGRTIDFNFTEFYDENDSLLYVGTLAHAIADVDAWRMQLPHSDNLLSLGRRPGLEIDLNAHYKIDNLKIYNYPHNAPGALMGATVPTANQPANQGVEVSVQSSGAAPWFLTQVRYQVIPGDGQWKAASLTPIGGDVYAAEIPGQSAKSMVQYYFRFEDQNGRLGLWPTDAESKGNYFYVGFADENAAEQAKTLDLDFEEGTPGPPVNQAAYGSSALLTGGITYSDDAAEGLHSLQCDGKSYGEVRSPFIGSDNYTVDFWFKSDSSLVKNAFLIAKNSYKFLWHQGQFRVREIGGPSAPTMEFRVHGTDGTGALKSLAQAFPYQLNQWYHGIAEVAANDSFYFALYSAKDSLVNSGGLSLAGITPLNDPTASLFLGGVADVYRTTERYAGKLDKIQILNYARTLVTDVDHSDQDKLPTSFYLSQNYPNPFNPTTTISFDVPRPDHIVLIVYDILGRKVAELMDKSLAAGRYSVHWGGTSETGRPVASGVYFYQITAKNNHYNKVHKMLLVR